MLATLFALVVPPALVSAQPQPPSLPPPPSAPAPPSAPTLAANPSLDRDALDFGSAPVSGAWSGEQHVTLTNTGGAALLIGSAEIAASDLLDFSETGGDCPLTPATPWPLVANASCTYALRFHPSAVGARSGTFSIHTVNNGDLRVSLSGDGLGPTATLSAHALDFGSSSLGIPRGPLSLTLSNPSSAPLGIAPIELSGPADFQPALSTNSGDPPPCGPVLVGGANCSLAFVFVPSAAGAISATATLITDDPISPRQTIALSGNGVPPPILVSVLGARPRAVLNQTHLDFGSQPVQTISGARAVTLTNSGNAPLTIAPGGLPVQPDFSPAVVPARFRSDPLACGAVLVPGATCTLGFTFHPSASGAREASFTLRSNDPAGTQTIVLTGSGAFDPKVRLTDPDGNPLIEDDPSNPLPFADEEVGTRSPRVSVVVTSAGSTALHFRDDQLVGSAGTTQDFVIDADSCPSLLDVAGLAPGKTCVISMSFKPTQPGLRTAILKLDTDAPTSVDRVDLAGTGRGAGYTLSAEMLDFGDQGVGSLSSQRTVQLTNSGTVPLAIQHIGLDSDPSAFLYVNPLDCPRVPVPLAPGAACTLAFRFLPTVGGLQTARLLLDTDAANAPPSLTLAGTGTLLDVQPHELDFGSVPIGTAAPQSITISNAGQTAAELLSIVVEDAANFLVDNQCPAQLQPARGVTSSSPSNHWLRSRRPPTCT